MKRIGAVKNESKILDSHEIVCGSYLRDNLMDLGDG